LAIIAVLTVQ